MANSIAYAKKYLAMLDRIFKEGAATALLTAAEGRYKFSDQNAKDILLQKITSQGMGTYSRATGYVAGDSDLTWETHSFGQDRGRKYNLDKMDAREAFIQVSTLMAEVMRTKIIPEVDAYRFHKMVSLCGVDETADLTYDDAVEAIDTGVQTLDDAEVPKEGRVLFVSNSMYKKMKLSGEKFDTRLVTQNNKIINRDIMYFDDMPLVRVPKARFYSAFDFYDGTTGGEEDGGFVVASGAKELNFMIVPVSLIIAVIKHLSPKLVAPEVNQSADGWIFAYRLYHDLFVPENKLDGVYVHKKLS